MIPKVKDYYLKDFELISSDTTHDFSIWVPDKLYIVLGRSNTIEESVRIDYAKQDDIEIVKRPSGGETVVLSDKMIVISYKFLPKKTIKIHDYFKKINSGIISALELVGIKGLQLKGISDIALDEKKILGSSMLKKSDFVFYHAVLNVSESPGIICKYLKHPKKEPDYRDGRTHEHFVTSIHNEGYMIDLNVIIDTLERAFSEFSSVHPSPVF
jgi:lipoate-protein ligase A